MPSSRYDASLRIYNSLFYGFGASCIASFLLFIIYVMRLVGNYSKANQGITLLSLATFVVTGILTLIAHIRYRKFYNLALDELGNRVKEIWSRPLSHDQA